MQKLSYFLSFLYFPYFLFGQSAERMDTVIVQAYQTSANWKNTAAAIALITQKQIDRQPNGSLVGVFNTIPGVRMEERSPGSYRLSMRGSLLRSPFGVRNIKVYFGQMPLTDATGNTYFNLLSPNQFNKIEIAKGPPANIYGASTGGAVIFDAEFKAEKKSAEASLATGSYGLINQHLCFAKENKNFHFQINQSHQQADGYREHTKFRRDIVQLNTTFSKDKHRLDVLAFYANLFYQTPGGLNATQFTLTPTMARPAAGLIPGAIQQQAGIYNQTFFGGATYQLRFREKENLAITIGSSFTNFRNPFITNYELRTERNFFQRSVFTKQFSFNAIKVKWTSGVELLFNQSNINNYGNRAGVKDSLQAADKIFIQQHFAFTQLTAQFTKKINITGGASINSQAYRYKRLSDPLAQAYAQQKLNPVISPRLSLLYNISNDISITGILSHGFSTPTLAEIRSSNNLFNTALQAEYGWNKEIIVKGYFLKRQWMFDLSFYQFNLQSAIVRRNNTAGQEYFINAGSTIQKGLELYVRSFFKPFGSIQLNGFISGAIQRYRFSSYKQNTADFTGNVLTGVPAELMSIGIDLNYKQTYFINFTGNYTGTIPLTDANDEWANTYRLLQIKTGYRWEKSKQAYEWFIFADNLLNEKYSLGNDINAAGRRFYNLAMPLNFVTGFFIKWK